MYRLFCLLMALHVLNFSVDSPDRYNRSTTLIQDQEDLSINDIESISELLLEECLGLVNAVPEHDEHDEEAGQLLSLQDYIFTQTFTLRPPARSIHFLHTAVITFTSTPVSTYVPDITSPPPQGIC
ncbi:hypothetical protein [Spirosoma sp. KUDC1026]|uniref:hypothetical protein n=1 Tax=Spirosoma sp. KUDC1026 TaxID=2745947 RepID=UPI00159BF055|nr:hypothetical protein [Spirosoma sp. KUDC1026]QKZ14302.1 hypothetical protein HU175_17380 [Spirosoma sp. KUDC1026]